ncbi:MAG: M23 family metallopeptidase [Pseudomonadota bacterium]
MQNLGVCRGLRSVRAGLVGAILVTLAACSSQTDEIIVAESAPDPRLRLAEFNTAEDVFATPLKDVLRGELKRRETLIDLLKRMGAPAADANRAVLAAADHIDLRRMLPGEEVTVFIERSSAGDVLRLTGLSMRPDPERHVLVTPSLNGDWVSRELKAKLVPGYARVAGPIETSIYELAKRQGAGDQQVVDFAQVFAYDIDFQREIYPGDRFEIVYETYRDERGNPIKAGDVVFAALNGKALSRDFYRFTPEDDGVTDYYDTNGESARKFLMKTPINGARLSSHFGRRRHPVLGYTKMHKGTDFAAPRGTPIYAAGHGVIERASRWGSFGHYIRIRHANGYKTAYAHLNGYAKGIRKGKRVRQGQTIGYVGTTGRSTGPHLHYEVHKNGKALNPMRLKLPTGRKLKGDMLESFEPVKSEIDALRAELNQDLQLAQIEDAEPTTN